MIFFVNIRYYQIKSREEMKKYFGEPGCAIQKALDHGELEVERWQSYLKLKNENAYLENRESYLVAKGKCEKEISKMIKKLPIKK